jgi:hypothetical protein
MLVDRTLIPNSEEDVTYLNIRENMNKGKSLTWFKHASSNIAKEFQIDIIIKMDTDVMLFPERVLVDIQRRLKYSHKNPRPNGVYGGKQIKHRGHDFMQGGFYFLSTDLASFITSKECDRSLIEEDKEKFGSRAEDAEIGALVNNYLGEVQWMDFVVPVSVWIHHLKLKDKKGLLQNWDHFLAEQESRIMFRSLREQYNGCPPEEAVMKALGQMENILARNMILGIATKCGGKQYS